MILKTTIIILLSCLLVKSSISSDAGDLKDADFRIANKIEIHYLKTKQNLIYTTSNKIHLILFKQLIEKAKNDPNLRCDSTGVIFYFNGNRQLLKIYFSTHATGSKLTSPTSAIVQTIMTLLRWQPIMLG